MVSPPDVLELAQKIANDSSMSATPTADKVFGIAELRCEILSQLHPYDLIRAIRVSRSFRASIRESLELQRCLFLLPKETVSPEMEHKANPFLLNWFQYLKSLNDIPGTLQEYFNSSRGDTDCTEDLVFNPSASFVITTETLLETFVQLRLLSHQSWQHMYLTQPPKERSIRILWLSRTAGIVRSFQVRATTIKDVVEAALDYAN